VIDVERDAERAAALRVESVAEVERLPGGIDAGAIGGVGRMQRLDRQRHPRVARIVQHLGDRVVHLRSRFADILRGRTARPRILRQSSHHKHHAGRAQRPGLVDGATVVVAHFGAMRGVRGKHPAAAIARQLNPGIVHRAIEPDCSDLVAPGIDRADAVRAQASVISARSPCLRTVAVLSDSQR
jgi:hypothetical protein